MAGGFGFVSVRPEDRIHEGICTRLPNPEGGVPRFAGIEIRVSPGSRLIPGVRLETRSRSTGARLGPAWKGGPMNKLGDASGAFDPLDYGGMVRMVFAFLERLALLREMHGADWPPSIVRPADRTVLLKLATETPAIIEAACLFAARTEGPFSLDFTNRILFDLERLNAELADVAKLESLLDRETENLELSTASRYSGLGPCFANVYAVWTALTETYSAHFRGPLRLIELRSKDVPQAPASQEQTEVSTRSEGQSTDLSTKAKSLSESEKKVGQEWNLVIQTMEKDSRENDELFDVADVTDERAYEFLCALLAERNEKPSQTFDTWRKYVGKFRSAAGNPKRPRRPR